jgi:hypothetical protein
LVRCSCGKCIRNSSGFAESRRPVSPTSSLVPSTTWPAGRATPAAARIVGKRSQTDASWPCTPPTANTLAAVTSALRSADDVMARWAALTAKDLPALNATLKAAGLPAIGGRPGR